MLLFQNYYSPLDVAIRWSGLIAHESEIVQAAIEYPERVSSQWPQWPTLHVYIERVLDAIDCRELPAWYLGHPLTFPSRWGPFALRLKATDLRLWISHNYPDDKPDFLFRPDNDHSQCISLGVYLALRATLECANEEIERLHQEVQDVRGRLEVSEHEREHMAEQIGVLSVPSEDTQQAHLTLIGAMLDVTVGNAEDGKPQSIYKTQTALVTTLTAVFPNVPGLKKHTIDRKFSEARRILIQNR